MFGNGAEIIVDCHKGAAAFCYADSVHLISRGVPAATPSAPVRPVVRRCGAIVASPAFDIAITGVILVNAVILGLETFESVVAGYHGLFSVAYDVILAIYVLEILIRFTAAGWNVRTYTGDRWNVFDFVVVAASFIPWLRDTAM